MSVNGRDGLGNTQCECEWERWVGKHSVSVNGRDGLGNTV